jgi:hypothetical protein
MHRLPRPTFLDATPRHRLTIFCHRERFVLFLSFRGCALAILLASTTATSRLRNYNVNQSGCEIGHIGGRSAATEEMDSGGHVSQGLDRTEIRTLWAAVVVVAQSSFLLWLAVCHLAELALGRRRS